MRLLLLATLALIRCTSPATAEIAPPDTLTEADGWVSDLVLTMTASQAAHRHWQEGGLNSLAGVANLNGRFSRVVNDFRQRHDTRLSLGAQRQDTLELRKSVDVIRYTFDLQYTGLGDLQPTFSTELRTQFLAGYDYNPTAERYPTLEERIVEGQPLKVSDFLAPATWTQSLGLSYEPDPWFRGRAGLGLKETIVGIERLRPIYGNRPDQLVRVQAGLDGLLEARGDIMENVRVQSRLSLFWAFTQFTEAAPDAHWENQVQLTVNRWLTVTGEVTALYDSDVIRKVQLRQTLALGFTFSIL